MKVMIFVDDENFCKSLKKTNIRRRPITEELPTFLMNYLENTLGWKKYSPELIRTYLYTGEYHDNVITKIKQALKYANENGKPWAKDLEELLAKSLRNQEGQRNFFRKAIKYPFIEIKKKPLQYAKGEVFQKGVDVQLAVDLVFYACIDAFDVALLCSGDMDLLESVRIVKNEGKQVIILSHKENTSDDMEELSDLFIDMAKLTKEDLEKFSYLLEPRKEIEE